MHRTDDQSLNYYIYIYMYVLLFSLQANSLTVESEHVQLTRSTFYNWELDNCCEECQINNRI
jgi:hypothetical protein